MCLGQYSKNENLRYLSVSIHKNLYHRYVPQTSARRGWPSSALMATVYPVISDVMGWSTVRVLFMRTSRPSVAQRLPRGRVSTGGSPAIPSRAATGCSPQASVGYFSISFIYPGYIHGLAYMLVFTTHRALIILIQTLHSSTMV